MANFVVVVQLIHRLAQAYISYTTTARLFFFPLLGTNPGRDRQAREEAAGDARDVEHEADLEALPTDPSDDVLYSVVWSWTTLSFFL